MLSRFKINLWIIGPTVVLLLLSLTILRSVLPLEVGKQIIFCFLGILIFILVSQIDYRILFPLAKILYALSLLLLITTFLFGETTRGSVRWLQIGSFSFQTSEIVKPLMIFSLAAFAKELNLKKYLHLFLFLFLLLLPVWLVLIQPDLGSALVITGIGIAIAFASGISLRIFSLALLSFILFLPGGYKLLKPYQQDRILAFINPFSDPLGSGYSVIQSMIAVGSGKLVGRGLGHGIQSQLRFLPERHSDFIFASLAEELGFIGSFLVLGSYALLLYQILKISKESADDFGSLIALGVFFMIFFQAVINIGMNIGILPITGITLPLISAGGSSLLAVMVSLGITHSISARRKPPKTIEIH